MIKLLQAAVVLAEFARNVWSVKLDHGADHRSLLSPHAWAHTRGIKAGDRVEAAPVSGEWLADYYVRKVDAVGVHLALLSFHDFTSGVQSERPAAESSAAEQDKPDIKVGFTAGDKWRAVRVSDGEVLVKGLASKAEAIAWVEENVNKPVLA